MVVREVDHRFEVARVLVVPDPRGDDGARVARRVHRAELGVDGGPTALGLHPADACLRAGYVIAEARAVRALVEAIARRLRPDRNWLEEDVVPWIASQRYLLTPSAYRSVDIAYTEPAGPDAAPPPASARAPPRVPSSFAPAPRSARSSAASASSRRSRSVASRAGSLGTCAAKPLLDLASESAGKRLAAIASNVAAPPRPTVSNGPVSRQRLASPSRITSSIVSGVATPCSTSAIDSRSTANCNRFHKRPSTSRSSTTGRLPIARSIAATRSRSVSGGRSPATTSTSGISSGGFQ